MKKFLISVACAVALLLSGKVAFAEDYKVDQVHSSISFEIAHMMVSKVAGTFNDFSGSIRWFDGKDLDKVMIQADIRVASIDTRNEHRDGHLRGADFFEAQAFPDMTFRSKGVVKQEGNVYLVTGDLTMKGVTKEVTVPVTVLGPVKNPMTQNPTIGLEAHFKVNRQDYGVKWNKALDNGGIMLGNDVDVSVAFEAGQALTP